MYSTMIKRTLELIQAGGNVWQRADHEWPGAQRMTQVEHTIAADCLVDGMAISRTTAMVNGHRWRQGGYLLLCVADVETNGWPIKPAACCDSDSDDDDDDDDIYDDQPDHELAKLGVVYVLLKINANSVAPVWVYHHNGLNRKACCQSMNVHARESSSPPFLPTLCVA